jgi:hypothetical protein
MDWKQLLAYITGTVDLTFRMKIAPPFARRTRTGPRGGAA